MTRNARGATQRGMWKLSEMRNRRQRGKYGEIRLAKKTGGIVVGFGRFIGFGDGSYIEIDPKNPPDVITQTFSFESKWLKNVPRYLSDVMAQATKNCPKGLTPIGVIGDRQNREVFYIWREKDFLDWHIGKIKR